MKKFIFLAITFVILIALLMPGAVGVIAENQFRSLANNVEESAPEYRWVVDDYQRGWFSSRAHYHLELSPALAVEMLADEDSVSEPLPTLASEATIFHGPIFFAGIGEPGVSMWPALAHSVDAISVVGEDATPTALPGSVSTRLGFFGKHTNVVALDPIETVYEEGRDPATIKWAGMRMKTRFNSALDELSFGGNFGAFEIQHPQIRLETRDLEISGQQRRSEFGFWTGDQTGKFGGLNITGTDQPTMSMGEMSWSALVEVKDGVANQGAVFKVESFEASGWAGGPVNLRARIHRLDPTAFGQILESMQNMAVAADEAPVTSSEMLDLVQALLSRGPEVDLEEFSIATPDGVLSLRAHLELPDNTGGALAMMLANLDATVNLRVPAAIADLLVAQNPEAHGQLQALVAAGLLLRQDDYLVMDAALKGALLTINGQPIPLPLGF